MYMNENKIEPIDALAEKSRFDAFICKVYPASCDECLYGWFSICQIDKKAKEKSINSTQRPRTCPLIIPSYKYDPAGYRYPGLIEAEWIKRNPILTKGSIVISLDLMKIKIGDGIRRYSELPFIYSPETSKTNTMEENPMYTREIKVETYREHAYCSKCGIELQLEPEDPMQPKITVAIFPPPPVKYTYICPICGEKVISEILYPRIIYKEDHT